MKERIIGFLQAENKSSSQFAEEIGVQPSSISHIISGRNNPSLDFVLKMLKRYDYIAADWLLFGKGEMYRGADMLQEHSTDPAGSGGREQVLGGLFDSGVAAGSSVEPADEVMGSGLTGERAAKRERNDVSRVLVLNSDGTFDEFIPSK